MGYLVQKTRASALTVGGQDYTASFVSLQVSDVSAFKNGLITTSGTLILGQRPGGVDIEDYDRNLFKRGTLVTLDIEEPGGAPYRHPRGYLYVLTLAYNVEAEQLEIQVGCRLSLAYLTDNASEVLPLVPIPLDPAQQTIGNCSASFASAGMLLYQDNQGNLVSRKFFGTDSSTAIEAGDWVSVLGETALSVTPLAGSNAIPDTIKLSYQVPEDTLASDDVATIATTTDISNYFIAYPAVTYTRVGELENSDQGNTISIPLPNPIVLGGCGNTPQPPSGDINLQVGEQVPVACQSEWTSERQTVYVPATSTAQSRTVYGGPGGQTSYVLEERTGPIIEANSQYFADKYAYCKQIYGYSCLPGGGCSYAGMNSTTLERSVTNYYYNDDGSLRQTVQDSYATLLSAANPEDWRSGVQDGVPQNFDQNFANTYSRLFLERRVEVVYRKFQNLNAQETTTWTSIASRGMGVSGNVNRLDATRGIKTSVKRFSSTTVVNDLRPDSVKSPTTQTVERSTVLSLNTNSYITPPDVAANYELEESIPVPLLSTDINEVNGWVADYSEYLTRFTKGDLYGLQIGESMRSEIVTGWYPGRPFRYADNSNSKISAMRMDACTWGVTAEEAIVVMNGVWNGFSSGTLSLGSNLVGNSTPDMGSLVANPKPNGITSASISVAGSGYVDGTYTGVSLTSTEEITSGSILSSGGGYADGTYTGVPLTSGSGTGAEATIQVVGGAVVSVVITSKGQGYTAGDTLSALDADLGGLGGAGFSYTADTVGDGTGAVATIQVVDGKVSSVIITDGGQDYAVGDTLSVLDASLGAGGGAGFAYTVNTVDERQTVPDAPTTPPGPDAPPSVVNDVVGQSFAFNIEVNLYLESYIFFYGENGIITPNPTDLTAAVDLTLIPWVGGLIVEAGGLLETTGSGSIPLDNEGLIVTTTATVVNGDLFA